MSKKETKLTSAELHYRKLTDEELSHIKFSSDPRSEGLREASKELWRRQEIKKSKEYKDQKHIKIMTLIILIFTLIILYFSIAVVYKPLLFFLKPIINNPMPEESKPTNTK